MTPTPNEHVDVVVIGGGPAGATAASLLRLGDANIRVVVLERARFPRPHIGESMLPTSNPILNKLGLLAEIDAAGFLRKGGAVYKWKQGAPCFHYIFAQGVNDAMRLDASGHIPDFAWQVERSRYDEILLARARALGADVREGVRVVDVVRDGERVTGVITRDDGELETGARRVITCDHVIDASGQARVLGHLLELPRESHELGDLAIYRYYEGFHWDEAVLGAAELSNIFFAATTTGWIWFIPIGHDLVSVGLVSRREFIRDRGLDQLFEDELASVVEMQAMLADAVMVPAPAAGGEPRSYTIQNWSYAHQQAAGPGWILVGDAAAFVDPVLSSGVMLAHSAGLWAANVVHTERCDPQVDVAALRSDYARFYADARAGFVAMARWWYHSRDVGIEDWWRHAGVLTREVTGAPVGDFDAFSTLLSGYLTDFRFTGIDLGFGLHGLSVCMPGLTGGAGPFDEAETGALRRVQRAFDRVEVGWFYGTYIETDRWWRLPLLRFHRGDEVIVHRPRVGREPDGTPRIAPVLELAAALVELCDGTTALGDLGWQCARWLELDEVTGAHPEEERKPAAERLATDLVRIGVLVLGDPVTHLRSRSAGPDDRTGLLQARVSGLRHERLEPGFPGVPAFSLMLLDSLRYHPPGGATDPRVGAAVDAVLAACDGQRSLEEVVWIARDQLSGSGVAGTGPHRLANMIIEDLLALGALTQTPVGAGSAVVTSA